MYMPAVRFGRADARMRNEFAMKNIPMPVIIHAIITAPAAAEAAIFCGRLYMPPPIIELSTIAPSPITPSLFAEAGEAGAAPVLESAIRVPFSYTVAGAAYSKLRKPSAVRQYPKFCSMFTKLWNI